MIRHLVCAPGSQTILAAEFDGPVHVFEKGISIKVLTINAKLDFGGIRLALIPRYQSFICGAYERYGIRAYTLKGEELWVRSDLKKVQVIKVSPDGDRAVCQLEGRSALVLDTRTGETIGRMPGIRNIYFDQDGSTLEERKGVAIYRTPDGASLRIILDSFALSDCAFSEEMIALVEAGKTVKLVCKKSGNILSLESDNDLWFSRKAAWIEGSNRFAYLDTNQDDGGMHRLMNLSIDGVLSYIRDLRDCHCFAFKPASGSLINASGTEYDAVTGAEIFQYQFGEIIDA